jgi:hypothetical protein
MLMTVSATDVWISDWFVSMLAPGVYLYALFEKAYPKVNRINDVLTGIVSQIIRQWT